MNEIRYILPDFTSYGRNEILINILKNHKHLLKDNVSIYSFYGTFPNTIWNGGRVNLSSYNVNSSIMKKVRNFYNRNGIAITFTFTNPLINEKHLNDEYCNQILEIFHNGKNEVLVVSPILEEYIRRNYPKYKINKSVTFASSELLKKDDKYNLVVINQNLNSNLEYLKNIECKEKIEILCDSLCFDYCKISREHYTELGSIQLGESNFGKNYGKCKYRDETKQYCLLANRNKTSKNYISSDKIHKIYAPMGFKYFKLSERDKCGMHPYIALDSIIDHFIKPEYQTDVRTYILERMLLEYSKECRYYLKINANYRKECDNRRYID